MTTPTTPRYRFPYGDLDGALLRLDLASWAAWSPDIDLSVAATRTFAYHGGYAADGTLCPDGTIAIPDGTTKYVQRTPAGVVTADAALDFPHKIPMAVATAAGGLLTHIEDIRDIVLAQVLGFFKNPMTTAGDLIVGGAVGAPGRLGISTNGYVLTLTGGVPVWAAPSGGGGGGGTSLFPKTMVQLHFDGTNGSTTFTDQIGRTFTASGNAKLDTSDKVFGTAAGLFDGTGDFLTAASHKSFALPQDFTIEFRVKTTQTGRQYCTIIERSNAAFNTDSWAVLFNTANSTDGKVSFWRSIVSGSGPTVKSSRVINDGTWHHIAVCGVGSLTMIFVDGVMEDQTASNGTPAINAFDLLIGKSVNASRDFAGRIDELRVVKGVAAYTTDFTPPTSAFADA
jgi:hypothetical protein